MRESRTVVLVIAALRAEACREARAGDVCGRYSIVGRPARPAVHAPYLSCAKTHLRLEIREAGEAGPETK